MKLESMIEYGERCYAQGAKQARTMTPGSEKPNTNRWVLGFDGDDYFRVQFDGSWSDIEGYCRNVEYWMELPEVPG